MSTLASLNVRIGADIKEFQKGLRQVNRDVRNATRGLRDVGGELTRSFSVPVAALAGLSIKMAGDFEASMNRVKAISGATGDEFEDLRQVAKDLGRTTQFSARQAADGLTFLSQAGFTAVQSTEALPGVLDLAAAGAIDLGEAADIATNVLTGFNLEVKDLTHLNDVLAKTFTSTNTNLQQLGEAFQLVAPVAAAAGISIEDTSAALGLLGNAGIQASAAGTTLRGIISRLLNPSAKAADILRRLGINAVDSSGQLRDLSGIIDDLRESGATTGDILEVFGQRAGPGMAALVSQGGEALRELSEKNLKSAGTAARIAEEQMKGFNGQMKELRSAAEGLAIAVGESGLLEKVTNLTSGITDVVQGLAKANPATINLATNIALVTAAVGPLLLVTAHMIKAVGTLRKAYIAMAAAAKIANTATAGWLGGLGAGLALVTPLLIGARNAYKGINEEIKEGVGQLETLRNFSGPGQGAYNYQIATGRDRSAIDKKLGGSLSQGTNLHDPFGVMNAGLKEANKQLPPFVQAWNDVKDSIDATTTPLKNVNRNLDGLELDQKKEDALGFADALQKVANAAIAASRQADISQRGGGQTLQSIISSRNKSQELPSIVSDDLSVGFEGVTASQSNLLEIAGKVNDTFLQQGSIMENISESYEKGSEAMKSLSGVIGDVASSMINVANQGGSFMEVAQEMKKAAQVAIGAEIRRGVASVVRGTLEKSAFLGPFAVPIGAAAGALAQGAFNSLINKISVPEFEQGGIFRRPTLGIIGEYPGASTDPEVVGKLSELRNIIGSPAVEVYVTGNISGRDIDLSNRRTGFLAQRTRAR